MSAPVYSVFASGVGSGDSAGLPRMDDWREGTLEFMRDTAASSSRRGFLS